MGELRGAFAIENTNLVTIHASCDGSFVAAGYFVDTLGLSGRGGARIELTGASGTAWLAAFDPDGAARWAQAMIIGAADGARAGPFAQRFADGSVVSGGTFGNVATFASGEPNETTLRSSSEQSEGYIAKYGADGHLLWAKHIAGVDTFVTDLSAGPENTTYAQISTAATSRVIGPGEIDFTIMQSEIALAVLDANGRFLRATRLTGSLSTRQMETLTTGGVAIAGRFQSGAVIAEGAPSAATLTAPDPSGRGWFHAVFTPMLAVESVHIFGPEPQMGVPLPDGSLFASGLISDTVTLEPGGPMETTLSNRSALGDDGYVARFDPSGQLSWVTQVTSYHGLESAPEPAGLADGSVFLRGSSLGQDGESGSIEISSGSAPARMLAVTGDAPFFARLDASGAPAWLVPLQSDGSDFVNAFAASPTSVVAIGRFNGRLGSGDSAVSVTFETPNPLSEDSGFVAIFGP